MTRYFLLAFVVVLALCVMQAYSAPVEEPTTPSSIEAALKSAGDSINQAFKDAKPQIDEFLSKSKDFFEDVGKKISDEASKIIPKSDEKAAAGA